MYSRKQPAYAVSAFAHFRDGIADLLEQRLADQFAPVILMDPGEPNLPMDAAAFLARSELRYFDESCSKGQDKDRPVAGPRGGALEGFAVRSCSGFTVSPVGTRSAEKKHTFYWQDLPAAANAGSADPAAWTTYFHAYRNDTAGITIQYWRFYSYNTGYFLGMKAWLGTHGGDWEAVHVVLGRAPEYRPQYIRLLGHKDITTQLWSAARLQGEHPIIRVDKGGHTSLLATDAEVAKQGTYLRQESWSDGRVYWPAASRTSPGAELKNLGEKTAPMPGMDFIRYSGLWGTRQDGLFGFYRSGYWGPAFNETSIRKDNFVSAWCEGIQDPDRRVTLPNGKIVRECFPDATVP